MKNILIAIIALFFLSACSQSPEEKQKQKLDEFLSGFPEISIPIEDFIDTPHNDIEIKYYDIFTDTTGGFDFGYGSERRFHTAYNYSGKVLLPNKNFDILFIYQKPNLGQEGFETGDVLYTISKEGKIISSLPFSNSFYWSDGSFYNTGKLDTNLTVDINAYSKEWDQETEEEPDSFIHNTCIKYKINNDGSIIPTDTTTYKQKASIIKLLRSLDEGDYGGVSHLKDEDFKTIDNEKRFIEYQEKKDGDFSDLFFKQIASGDRDIFVKASYSRYLSSPDIGYNDMGGMNLIEHKDGKWINLQNELPPKWTKLYYRFVLNADNSEILMYKIKFDKKTGEETDRELVETGTWEDGKFIVKNSSDTTPNQTYKVIVAYAVGEVSEDWNYFFDDIMQYFKDKGVYVVYSDTKKAVVDNADLSIEIDLTDILAKNGNKEACYIFLEKGRDAKCVDYDMSEGTIEKAKEYFGLN